MPDRRFSRNRVGATSPHVLDCTCQLLGPVEPGPKTSTVPTAFQPCLLVSSGISDSQAALPSYRFLHTLFACAVSSPRELPLISEPSTGAPCPLPLPCFLSCRRRPYSQAPPWSLWSPCECASLWSHHWYRLWRFGWSSWSWTFANQVSQNAWSFRCRCWDSRAAQTPHTCTTLWSYLVFQVFSSFVLSSVFFVGLACLRSSTGGS